MSGGRARAENRRVGSRKRLTVGQAIKVLGRERAEEIRRLAREDGVPEETMARLKLAALIHLAYLDGRA